MTGQNHHHIIRLVALQGSVRPQSNTGKALAVIANYMEQQEGLSLEIIDPSEMHIALPGQGTTDDARHMQQVVREADGVILATPEYHGSYSSVMKLLIDNLGFPSALKGKPVSLLGVAAGRIGAIKAMEHLRSVASHVGALVLPGPVSIASVRNVFDAEGGLVDPDLGEKLNGVATSLIEYVQTRICPLRALEAMEREA